jgi:hypothetical protein
MLNDFGPGSGIEDGAGRGSAGGGNLLTTYISLESREYTLRREACVIVGRPPLALMTASTSHKVCPDLTIHFTPVFSHAFIICASL